MKLIEKKEISSRLFLTAKKTVTIPEIRSFADESIGRLYQAAEELELTIVGPCEFIYFDCKGELDEPFDLRIGVPVEEKKKEHSLFTYYESPAFTCVCRDYVGSVERLGNEWALFSDDAAELGIVFHPENQAREVYKQWIAIDSEKNITELQIRVE
jgi:hypothetical protein